jgi:hypothetical protein
LPDLFEGRVVRGAVANDSRLRLVVAAEASIDDRLATVRERGLFVYDSVANVATLMSGRPGSSVGRA